MTALNRAIPRVAVLTSAMVSVLALAGGCASAPEAPAATAEAASTAPVRVEWYRCSEKQGDEYITSESVSSPRATVVYRTERPSFTERNVARTEIIRDESSGAPILIAFLSPESADFLATMTARGAQQPILTVIDGTPATVTTATGNVRALVVARQSQRYPDTQALNALARRVPQAQKTTTAR